MRPEGRRQTAFCVQVCPTRALSLQEGSGLLKVLRSKGRFHVNRIADSAEKGV